MKTKKLLNHHTSSSRRSPTDSGSCGTGGGRGGSVPSRSTRFLSLLGVRAGLGRPRGNLCGLISARIPSLL